MGEKKRKRISEDGNNGDINLLGLDLLENIAGRLTSNLADYVRFRAVCRSWRSATIDPRRLRSLPSQLPWIIFQHDPERRLISYFSLAEGRTRSLTLPETCRGKSFSFSSDGWFVLEDHSSLSITLLNPLTGDHLHLPPFTNIQVNSQFGRPLEAQIRRDMAHHSIKGDTSKYRMTKTMAMSGNPTTSDNCTILVIINIWANLLSYQLGDDRWTVKEGYYDDVIFFKERFYAATIYTDSNLMMLYLVDLHLAQLTLISTVTLPLPPENLVLLRLVNDNEELLMLYSPQHQRRNAADLSWNYGYKWIEMYRFNQESQHLVSMEVEKFKECVHFLAWHGRPLKYPLEMYPQGEPYSFYIEKSFIWHSAFNFPVRLESLTYFLIDGSRRPTLPWSSTAGDHHALSLANFAIFHVPTLH